MRTQVTDPITGVKVNKFTATTKDGVFTVILYFAGRMGFVLRLLCCSLPSLAAGALATINGTTLPANAQKLDVLINNFPYTNPSNDSSLALRSVIVTKEKTRTEAFDFGTAGDIAGDNVNVRTGCCACVPLLFGYTMFGCSTFGYTMFG
jgi:hypothetical protein